MLPVMPVNNRCNSVKIRRFSLPLQIWIVPRKIIKRCFKNIDAASATDETGKNLTRDRYDAAEHSHYRRMYD